MGRGGVWVWMVKGGLGEDVLVGAGSERIDIILRVEFCKYGLIFITVITQRRRMNHT